jgi:UDPglucose 6-dehydrogenase
LENAEKKWPDLSYADRVEDAVRDAELVLVLTEWREYVALRPHDLEPHVAEKRILDGRNCLDPALWRGAGWTYRALGRP